jgi:hypothetical protein
VLPDKLTMVYERNYGLTSTLPLTFDFRHALNNFDCHSMALNEQENYLLLVGNHQLKFIHFDMLLSSMSNKIMDDPSMIIVDQSHVQSVPLVDLSNIHRPIVQWNHHDMSQYALAVDRLVRVYAVEHGQIRETSTIIDTQHQVRQQQQEEKKMIRKKKREKGRKREPCVGRESNPGRLLGRQPC